jgi:hypothetical protein
MPAPISPWKYEYGASYINPNGFKISFGSGGYWTRATQINKFSATLSNEAFPGGYSAWAVTNAGGQAANLDWDNDGVSNGVEFFMNATPGFTANPVLDGTNKVTWPNGGNIPNSGYGSQFVVQTSIDLANWTDVPGIGDANLVNTPSLFSYSLTTGSNRQFVRLLVMPN